MTDSQASTIQIIAAQHTPEQKYQGFTLWFTGLSGAGKSTISQIVREELARRELAVEVLDGDVVRRNLSQGLGFSKADRDANIRRIAFVAGLLSKHGVIAITAAISPYREIRDEARASIGRFVEVYVRCPLEVLIARDVKGLYRKALAGEIQNFTGVSDPYEEPLRPEVTVDTSAESADESAWRVISYLESAGYIPAAAADGVYSAEEEAEVSRRLADLGYV